MKIAIVIIVVFLGFGCYAQEMKCADFKNGKFGYTDKDYAELITVRTDSIQTDTYPKLGMVTESRIKWLSDCKYEMRIVKVSDASMESMVGMKFTIEIVKIENNKFRCRSKSQDMIVEREMIKLED